MSTKRRTFRMTFAVAVVLLLAAAVLLTDVLGNFGGARADLTSDRLYTMSPAARDILGDLQAPVQIKYYVTGLDEMPTELKTLERDVTDKLRDYARASDGMVEFTVHDPQNDEEMQGTLGSRGIRPFQVSMIAKDERSTKLIWSAMTVAYKDHPEEVLPQVLPQSLVTLEYELISRVYRLTQERQPKVALVAPLQTVDQQTAMMYLQQGMQPPEPQDIYAQLTQFLQQERYLVERVDVSPESPIPADADLLVVVNPVGFSERQAFEINRAISNGMNAVIAVQTHDYGYQPGMRDAYTISGRAHSSGLEGLLAEFGATVSGDHLFDASSEVLSVPREQNIGGLRFQTNEPLRLPIHVLVTDTQMNADTAISNRISALLYLWGSHLDLDDSKLAEHQLERTVLFTSSGRTWTEPFSEGIMAGSLFRPDGKEITPHLPLAVELSGRFPDAFAQTGVPEWPAAPAPGAEDELPPPADDVAPLMREPARVVVVGCAKMFDDMAFGAGQNPLFLLNAVDSLVHGQALVSIRSKMLTQRVIRPVSDGEKVLFRLFTIVMIPVALVIFGLTRASRRRKEAAR